MKRILTISLFGCLVLGVISSCSKYPEGPKFTLITKTQRLANEWILTSYMINGNEFIATQPQTKLAIDKDGTYSISATETVLGQIQSNFSHGTWALSEEKTNIEILVEGEDIPVSYLIRDLRKNKLVLQFYNKITNITYVSIYETDK